MHAFLIAMNVWFGSVVLGVLLMLKDGDKQSTGSLISTVIALSLGGWAFALLVTGH